MEKIWYIFDLRNDVSSWCFWKCLISMWYFQKCNIWQYLTFFAIISICLSFHIFAKQIYFSSSSVEISIIAATIFLHLPLVGITQRWHGCPYIREKTLRLWVTIEKHQIKTKHCKGEQLWEMFEGCISWQIYTITFVWLLYLVCVFE